MRRASSNVTAARRRDEKCNHFSKSDGKLERNLRPHRLTFQFAKKEKNVEVVSSFASSSMLARQIEAGAPADLFISADQKWMDYAVEKKAIDAATRETLLGNSLVVVAPKASAA